MTNSTFVSSGLLVGIARSKRSKLLLNMPAVCLWFSGGQMSTTFHLVAQPKFFWIIVKSTTHLPRGNSKHTAVARIPGTGLPVYVNSTNDP